MKKELNDFFASVSPTIEQKEAVFRRILTEDHNINSHRSKMPLILIAVVVLLIGSITSMSAMFDWHEKLIEHFNPTRHQIEQLEEAVNMPMVTKTDNGVTVTVLQTLADKHGIYVLYEITAPEEFEFTDSVRWHEERLLIDYAAEDRKPGMGGSMFSKVLSQTKNKRTVLLCRNGSGDIISQRLRMCLSDIGYYTQTGVFDFKTNIQCDFEMEWDFTYKDSGEHLTFNQGVTIVEGRSNIIKSIDISPISVWMEITGDDVMTSIKPVINFKNGEKLIIDTNKEGNLYNAYTPLYGGINSVGCYFDEIIDIEEIESISIGNAVIPIE